MMRQGPTASVLLSTDLGEMKIPEPMIVPTMMQMPLSRPTSDVEEGREALTRHPPDPAFSFPPSVPPMGAAHVAPSEPRLDPGAFTLCCCCRSNTRVLFLGLCSY